MRIPQNIQKYGSGYDTFKFWKKLEKTARKAGVKCVYAALCLYYALYSPYITKKDRRIIIGALGYFILPLDIIPDFIPGAGFSDDIAALVLAAYKVARGITPEVKDRAKEKVYEWFGDIDADELDLTPQVDWYAEWQDSEAGTEANDEQRND